MGLLDPTSTSPAPPSRELDDLDLPETFKEAFIGWIPTPFSPQDAGSSPPGLFYIFGKEFLL